MRRLTIAAALASCVGVAAVATPAFSAHVHALGPGVGSPSVHMYGSPGIHAHGIRMYSAPHVSTWHSGSGIHYFRHRHGVFIAAGYPYYYDYDYGYYGGCGWLRRRAVATDSPYWWRRYRACLYYRD